MLSAGEIKRLIVAGEIDWPGELRADSLLLRLGAPLQFLVQVFRGPVDLADQHSIDQLYTSPREQWSTVDLEPGRMVLCQVEQPVRLGAGVAGAMGTLSHLARVGLATHVTSPWVLPGWNGHLTLELLNTGPATLRIHRGMPVARLVLFAMTGPTAGAERHPFYGTGRYIGSRYADEFPYETYRR